ncbi:hypothetical protein PX52LOC_05597 [Limnoglobus roseus]|uniref:Uncharacterized protein n=1 Tax=Limnoglobus roseus TaxID=2598579 RepID=A0A5C1AIT4_9BACT|nr:hypothetical protein PX52LOC_05597 [Limnoglobus roseus]
MVAPMLMTLPGSADPALVTLGGRDLVLTPIPPADAWKFRKAAVTKIQAKMRDPAELALRAVAQARAAGEPLSAEDRSALFREALAAAAVGKREPTAAEIQAWTMTAQGMREFVFLAAVGNTPAVTRVAEGGADGRDVRRLPNRRHHPRRAGGRENHGRVGRVTSPSFISQITRHVPAPQTPELTSGPPPRPDSQRAGGRGLRPEELRLRNARHQGVRQRSGAGEGGAR